MRYIFRDVMVQADYEDDHNYQSKQTHIFETHSQLDIFLTLCCYSCRGSGPS